MELYYIWFGVGIIFLIVEILTVTFYGLSLALASFIVASIVYLNGDNNFTIFQSIVFVITSIIFALIFTKFLRPKKVAQVFGLDNYIGTYHKLEKIGNDWKLKIDGVDYLIDDDCINDTFSVGKKIKIISHKSGSFVVEIV
ncbi:MAG: hypothetical protein PHR68_05640 [Candidatus Gracilibacteria bacterium]|nr:hypothetical protein [Candidatus Gracilibacteria bacterium]